MTDQYSVKLTMGLFVDITSAYPSTTVQNVLREYNAETTPDWQLYFGCDIKFNNYSDFLIFTVRFP